MYGAVSTRNTKSRHDGEGIAKTKFTKLSIGIKSNTLYIKISTFEYTR